MELEFRFRNNDRGPLLPTFQERVNAMLPANRAAAAPAAPAVPAGLSAETVAVIAAAVTACGYSVEQIHAIRPAEQPAWRDFGRAKGMRTPR